MASMQQKRNRIPQSLKHNRISEADKKRVSEFLKGCGPYAADVWSDAYLAEIVAYLNERDAAHHQGQQDT